MTDPQLAADARDHLTHARCAQSVLTLTVALDAAQQEVWHHLVDPDLLATWSPVVPDRSLECVGRTTAREDPQAAPVDATVAEARAPWFLEHRWGPDNLTWQLAPSGEKTQLNLVHELTRPETAADMAAGWHLCLTVLRRRLQGLPTDRCVGQDALDHGWHEARERYERAFREAGAAQQQP